MRAVGSGSGSSSDRALAVHQPAPAPTDPARLRDSFFREVAKASSDADAAPKTVDVDMSLETILRIQGDQLAVNPGQAMAAPEKANNHRRRPNYDGRKRKHLALQPVERRKHTAESFIRMFCL